MFWISEGCFYILFSIVATLFRECHLFVIQKVGSFHIEDVASQRVGDFFFKYWNTTFLIKDNIQTRVKVNMMMTLDRLK